MNPFLDTSTITIADIVIRDAWQVRKGISASTVKRYEANYLSGNGMEPIRLARVGSALMLLDGAHRLAALRSLGHTEVEAIVTPMKEMEAQWAAASANLEHGLPLKAKELREVFRQYVATGQHRKGRGKVKPLRDIPKDIPGVRSHVTIRNWMLKDHPDLYARHYAGSNASGSSYGGLRDAVPHDQQAADLQAIEDHLRQAAALARTISSKSIRGRIAKRVEATMVEVLA